jgi:hypothetical protein
MGRTKRNLRKKGTKRKIKERREKRNNFTRRSVRVKRTRKQKGGETPCTNLGDIQKNLDVFLANELGNPGQEKIELYIAEIIVNIIHLLKTATEESQLYNLDNQEETSPLIQGRKLLKELIDQEIPKFIENFDKDNKNLKENIECLFKNCYGISQAAQIGFSCRGEKIVNAGEIYKALIPNVPILGLSIYKKLNQSLREEFISRFNEIKDPVVNVLYDLLSVGIGEFNLTNNLLLAIKNNKNLAGFVLLNLRSFFRVLSSHRSVQREEAQASGATSSIRELGLTKFLITLILQSIPINRQDGDNNKFKQGDYKDRIAEIFEKLTLIAKILANCTEVDKP